MSAQEQDVFAHLKSAVWMGKAEPKGMPVHVAVGNMQPGAESEAQYQAFRRDYAVSAADYVALCPPCPVLKAYDKAKQVILGNEQVIADARTLYALSAVLIGLLNHGKYAGMFALPDAPRPHGPAVVAVTPPAAEGGA